MYCVKCGKELKQGWERCPQCGAEASALIATKKPTQEAVEGKQQAVINLRRPSQYWYKFRKFGVIINDKKMGTISDGGKERFEVQPGKHSIYVNVDWVFKSEKLVLDLHPGETVNLICGGSGKGTLATVAFGIFAAAKPGVVLHLRQE